MLLTLALGWCSYGSNGTTSKWTYRFEEGFHAALFSLYVHDPVSVVERSARSWVINSEAQIEHVDSHASVLIRPSSLPKSVVAQTRFNDTNEILVNRDLCFVDFDCTFLAAHRVYVPFLLSAVMSLGAFIAYLSPRARPLALASSCAAALLLAFPVLPCSLCYSLFNAVAHEFGHLLGLSHADGAKKRCGCGHDVAPCQTAYPAVMTRTTTPALCLFRDDVDAARTLHGGRCDAPVMCEQASSLLEPVLWRICAASAVAAALTVHVRQWQSSKELAV